MLQTVDQLFGGALVLAPPRFQDPRGIFTVPFEATAAAELGLPERFVQDNHSVSFAPGTVRGIHVQLPPHEQGKLIRVLRGRIFDVIVDLRPTSVTVGQVATIELSADDERMLWLPSGFGHGFCTLVPDTEVFYKVDNPYCPAAELSLAWDAPDLDVEWPVTADQAVLSDKDRRGVTLTEALATVSRATQESQRGRRPDPSADPHPAGPPADRTREPTVSAERLTR